MYLGIDLGTSALKLAVMTDSGAVKTHLSAPLAVSSPKLLWSEQDPRLWWQALDHLLLELKKQMPLASIQGIGLSGQMHGAVLLDAQGALLRPAILWNDGRSYLECQQLELAHPEFRRLTGNLMMPGFTAPKLCWLRQHEPDCFARVHKILLPKDYLRWRLTSDLATDCSDAAGTGWLDMAARQWHPDLVGACGLELSQLPQLYEGSQVTGYLRSDLASRWGMRAVPVVAGGGDNAAAAVGVGVVEPGQRLLSVGTSGVYFVTTSGFLSHPEAAVHSFCHALPKRWHLMSVMLSAASCLGWLAGITGAKSVAAMLAEVAQAEPHPDGLCFLPYLTGERTPLNNPGAKGVFFGLSQGTDRAALGQAVLEGVGFGLAAGVAAVEVAGAERKGAIYLVGGGGKSPYWAQMLADIIGQPLVQTGQSEVGPALGAARLARVALTPERSVSALCPPGEIQQRFEPCLEAHQAYCHKRALFDQLYGQLEVLMTP